MAGSKSDFLELEVLDHVLGNAAYTAPTNVYVALYTADPSDAGGGTECNTEVGSYARKVVVNNDTNWPAAAAGAKANGAEITFVEATASWGTICAFGIFDNLTAGNLLYWAELTTNKTIDSGDTAKFAVGDLDVTED